MASRSPIDDPPFCLLLLPKISPPPLLNSQPSDLSSRDRFVEGVRIDTHLLKGEIELPMYMESVRKTAELRGAA